MLNMKECNKDVLHLGNPLFFSRNKSDSLDFLKRKVHDRIEGWMAKTISNVGRSYPKYFGLCYVHL